MQSLTLRLITPLALAPAGPATNLPCLKVLGTSLGFVEAPLGFLEAPLFFVESLPPGLRIRNQSPMKARGLSITSESITSDLTQSDLPVIVIYLVHLFPFAQNWEDLN